VELDGAVLTTDMRTRVAPIEVVFSPASMAELGKTVSETMGQKGAGAVSGAHAPMYDSLSQLPAPSSLFLPKEGHSGAYVDPDHRDRRGGAHAAAQAIAQVPLPLALASLPVTSPVMKIVTSDLAQRPRLGVAQLIAECLASCDEELKHDFANSIVLMGGTSLTPGIASRLEQELKQLLGPSRPINIVCDSRRHHACWIGASMLASLPTIKMLSLTAAEFESDPSLVHKRYF
jgi:hypothetical protein